MQADVDRLLQDVFGLRVVTDQQNDVLKGVVHHLARIADALERLTSTSDGAE